MHFIFKKLLIYLHFYRTRGQSVTPGCL